MLARSYGTVWTKLALLTFILAHISEHVKVMRGDRPVGTGHEVYNEEEAEDELDEVHKRRGNQRVIFHRADKLQPRQLYYSEDLSKPEDFHEAELRVPCPDNQPKRLNGNGRQEVNGKPRVEVVRDDLLSIHHHPPVRCLPKTHPEI
jgi:hypothetical protein